MVRWLAAFVILAPVAALAQTSAPGVLVGAAKGDDPSSSAQALGEHICPGYPDRAAQNMVKGATQLSFQISPEGKVTNVVVQSSSGSQQLDAAARLCVMGWLYKPQMQDGKPVAVPGSARITWKSPDDDGPQNSQAKTAMVSVPIWRRGGYSCIGWHTGSKLPPHNVVMSFFVETDGTVKDVAVSQSSGDAEADSDAVKCLSQRHYEPAKQDGKPIEVHISDWLY